MLEWTPDRAKISGWAQFIIFGCIGFLLIGIHLIAGERQKPRGKPSTKRVVAVGNARGDEPGAHLNN